MKRYLKSFSIFVLVIIIMQSVVFPISGSVMNFNVYALEQEDHININFQSDAGNIPRGYIPDYGNVYGNRQGFTYGWNIDHEDNVVNRNILPEYPEDSFSEFHEGGIWEIALVSGEYDVRVSVGDAVYGSTNTINVEGISYWNDASLNPGEFLEETKQITVNDGKLTIDNGNLGESTRINYVEISRVYNIQADTSTDITPPTSPGNLKVGEISDSEITLYWDDSTDDQAIKGYIIYRDDNELAVLDSTYYKDTDFEASTTYNYSVVAVDHANNISEKSTSLTVKTATELGTGIGLKGEYYNNGDFSDNRINRTDHIINFDWGGSSPNLELEPHNFVVRWSGKVQPRFSETYTFYTETHGGVRLWVDDQLLIDDWDSHSMSRKSGEIQLSAGQLYDIKMEYIENGGAAYAKLLWSSNSVDKEVIPKSQLYPSFIPQAPEYIVSQTTSTTIQITWDEVYGATSYDIEVDGAIFNNGENASYVHQDLLPNSQHSYRVRSKIPGVIGNWSAPVINKTKVGIPQKIVTTTGTNIIEIAWDLVEGSTGYEIEIDGDVKDNGSSTIFIHEGIMPNTEHTYRVRAKNDNEAGDWSILFYKGISYEIPMNLRTTATSSIITVTWDSVEEAIGYDIEVDGVVVNSGLETTYFHKNLIPNMQYTYRVRVKKDNHVGEWSGYIVQSTLPEPGNGVGLKAKYYKDNNLIEVKHILLDETIDFDWKRGEPAPGINGDEFSVSWTGQIEPIFSENYTIYTESHGGVRLWIDDELIIDAWEAHNTIHRSGTVILRANNRYDIKMQYKESNGVSRVQLLWSSMSQGKEVVPRSQLYPVGIPQNISTSSTDKSIEITWDEVTFADSYDIEVDGHLVENINEHHYLHQSLILGTLHGYRIRANTGDISGEWSPSIAATTRLGKIMNTEIFPTESTLSISWDSVEGATAYDIEVDGIITHNGLSTSFMHENLLSGTLHKYRIRAKSSAVIGEWTDVMNKWTLPDIPQNIQITSTSTSNTLVWDEVRGAIGYDVEVYGNPVDTGSLTTYTDADINTNTQRTYRIRAKNSSGFGKWTDIVAKTTLPDTPQNLDGIAMDTTIKVLWDSVAGAKTYELEMDGQLITDIFETGYIHEQLTPNSSHSYRVRARNIEGTSNWSKQVIITSLPSIPLNLQAVVTSQGIKVTWNAVDGVTGYDIEVDGKVIDNQADTTFMHIGIEPNSEHTYRVRAKNGDITGHWTELITRTTLVGVPTNIRATNTSTEITVMWDMVAGSVGYDIEVDGIILDNGLSTTFIHKNLMPNTEHTYRVRTKNSGGLGDWSDYLKVTTVFGTPENIVTVPKSDSVTLFWDPVVGATEYDVFVDGEVVSISDGLTYIHSNLEPFSWHVYRVRAKSGNFIGEWSESVTVATLLGIPSNIKGVAESNRITVKWDAVIGATAYEIEADGITFNLGLTQNFTHNNLLPNTLHTYRIRAKNKSVVSEWSGTSDWSTLLPIMTPPNIPTNLQALATTNEIKLTWDSVENAKTYDIEVDGKIINDLSRNSYNHVNLEPNTRHKYRVRAKNGGGASGWTEIFEQNTVPEITINVEKDNMFNFVIIAPKKKNAETREIVVKYDAEKLEVLDLCASTPEVDLKEGEIPGTNIRVVNFKPGEISYVVNNGDKTTVNAIKFIVKTNEHSKVTYTIK